MYIPTYAHFEFHPIKVINNRNPGHSFRMWPFCAWIWQKNMSEKFCPNAVTWTAQLFYDFRWKKIIGPPKSLPFKNEIRKHSAGQGDQISPAGQLLCFGSFRKTQKQLKCFYTLTVMRWFVQRNGLGYTVADFFTNKSGRPAAGPLQSQRTLKLTKSIFWCDKRIGLEKPLEPREPFLTSSLDPWG
jgi:hypothetical protein